MTVNIIIMIFKSFRLNILKVASYFIAAYISINSPIYIIGSLLFIVYLYNKIVTDFIVICKKLVLLL